MENIESKEIRKKILDLAKSYSDVNFKEIKFNEKYPEVPVS